MKKLSLCLLALSLYNASSFAASKAAIVLCRVNPEAENAPAAVYFPDTTPPALGLKHCADALQKAQAQGYTNIVYSIASAENTSGSEQTVATYIVEPSTEKVKSSAIVMCEINPLKAGYATIDYGDGRAERHKWIKDSAGGCPEAIKEVSKEGYQIEAAHTRIGIEKQNFISFVYLKG